MKNKLVFLFVTLNILLFPKSQEYRKQDDFYSAVNTEWFMQNDIPKKYPSWNNFSILEKKVSNNLRDIVEEGVKNKENIPDETNERKLINFYINALDYENRDKEGIKPIEPLLDKVKSLSNKDDISGIITYLFNHNTNVFFRIHIDADYKDSNTNILYLDPAYLGMADRKYYLYESKRILDIQNRYKSFLSNLFILSGYDNKRAQEKAENVFEFERKLASVKLSKRDRMNHEKIYNVYTIKELEHAFPEINWKAFFRKTGLNKAKKIVVTDPYYLKILNNEISKGNLEVVKDYMESVILIENMNFLSREFEEMSFEYNRLFSNLMFTNIKTDEERAFELLDSTMGDMLGIIYVEKYFSEEEKKDVELIVKKIIDTYKEKIYGFDWLSDSAKRKAIKKLDTMNIKIGYSDIDINYGDLEIKAYKDGGSLYANIQNIITFERKKAIRELNEKVDKDKWNITPQTINAYYDPRSNEIVFPAAMLQAPFYDYNSSKAKNYGGLGTIIGHEIFHAFDSEGSKFDEYGNLENWWTEEDRKNYSLKTEALAKQYSKYLINGKKVNGRLTLAENMADLSGVLIMVEIMKKESPDELKDFFEAYASIWRSLVSNERISFLIKVDPHSPEKYRVNGILSNIDEFYLEYEITKRDKMYISSENRIKLW